MSRIFKTLGAPAVYTYEEKRSRFIAHLCSVSDKDQGFKYFDQIKQAFPDARHHCWAYIIGDPEQAQSAGFNDDGEPGGTAGKPMLNVLTQRKVGNIFAVVVRYFGGIKLGAGGLTRAYGQAISKALDNAEWVDVIPMTTICIKAEYALESRLRNILASFNISNIHVEYQQNMILTCPFPEHQFESLQDMIQEQSNGQAICKESEE